MWAIFIFLLSAVVASAQKWSFSGSVGFDDGVRGSCVMTEGDSSGPELKRSARLRVGAFNVKHFGRAKMAKGPDVVGVLTRIVLRYDLLLIQELLDSSYPGQRAIDALLCSVNAASNAPYSVIVSDRVGRLTSPTSKGSAHREQYAFVYRSDRFRVRRSFHYDDGDESAFEDEFMREPFVVHFQLDSAKLTDLIAVGLHTRPANTPAELRALSTVHANLLLTFPRVQDIVIMGDLNADCDYASTQLLEELRRDVVPGYVWLIDDDADTTVKDSTDCAYDRILVTGPRLLDAAPRMGSVFRFDQEDDFPQNLDAFKDISDHYPVEMSLNVG